MEKSVDPKRGSWFRVLPGVPDKTIPFYQKAAGSVSGTRCFDKAVDKTRSLTWTP